MTYIFQVWTKYKKSGGTVTGYKEFNEATTSPVEKPDGSQNMDWLETELHSSIIKTS